MVSLRKATQPKGLSALIGENALIRKNGEIIEYGGEYYEMCNLQWQ